MRSNHLATKVRTMLGERGYKKDCPPLEALAQRIEGTERNLARKVFVYKWPGLILLALIPILSTLLSVLVTHKPGATPGLLQAITVASYALTFLTVINSIFRPSERFKEACRMGVDFELIKSAFLIELEDILEPEKGAGGAHMAGDAHLHTLINKFNKQVAPYQKELISMFLPEVAVEKTKNVGIVAGRPSYHGAGEGKHGERTRRSA